MEFFQEGFLTKIYGSMDAAQMSIKVYDGGDLGI